VAPRYPSITADDLKDPNLTVLLDVLRSFHEELQSLRGDRGSIALNSALNMQNAPIANAQSVGVGNTSILSGDAHPENSKQATVGSFYLRGGSTPGLFFKQSGNNTKTGWKALVLA